MTITPLPHQGLSRHRKKQKIKKYRTEAHAFNGLYKKGIIGKLFNREYSSELNSLINERFISRGRERGGLKREREEAWMKLTYNGPEDSLT